MTESTFAGCGRLVYIQLSGEPVAWARTRLGSRGIPFTPTKQRNAGAAFKLAAMEAMAGRAPFDCPVVVSFKAEFQIPAGWSKKKKLAAMVRDVLPTKRPDLSNLVKLFEDACNGVVFRDDSLIVEYDVLRKVYGEHPGVAVHVRPA